MDPRQLTCARGAAGDARAGPSTDLARPWPHAGPCPALRADRERGCELSLLLLLLVLAVLLLLLVLAVLPLLLVLVVLLLLLVLAVLLLLLVLAVLPLLLVLAVLLLLLVLAVLLLLLVLVVLLLLLVLVVLLLLPLRELKPMIRNSSMYVRIWSVFPSKYQGPYDSTIVQKLTTQNSNEKQVSCGSRTKTC